MLQEDKQTGAWGVVSRLHSNLASGERMIVVDRYKPGPEPGMYEIKKLAGRLKMPQNGDAEEVQPFLVEKTRNDENFGVVMKIPPHLVMSSLMLDSSSRNLVRESMAEQGIPESAQSSFCLVTVFLDEWSKGRTSIWHPYLQSLPKKLSIGLHWDATERECAEKIGLGSSLKTHESLYEGFQKTLDSVCPGHTYDPQLVKWVFSAVWTRSWKSSYTSSTGEQVVSIVCLGGLFNHRADHNVCIEQDSPDSPVAMVLMDPCDGDLHLNYGSVENPAHFPVVC